MHQAGMAYIPLGHPGAYPGGGSGLALPRPGMQ
jgi:hypothetical protein